MRKPWFLTLAISIGIAGCNVQDNPSLKLDDFKATPVAEAVRGDFVYRLIAERDTFEAGGPISMYAELEYTGEQASIDIFHAASPFYFELLEKTRDFEIPYAMDEPLLVTTLVKGEPLREDYRGSGSYSENDPKEYRDFIGRLTDNQFSEGFYEVNGFANFFTGNPEEDKTDFDIHAVISFKVVE